MQKLPEFPNRKRGWRMRKDRKAPSWQRGTDYLSLAGSDRRFDHIVADGCLGTTHTSLDVALVSPFHPVAVLSRSALCWNIQDPQMNYNLTLTGLWQTSKKKTNSYGRPKYQMRTNTYMKRLTYFWHVKMGDSAISMYSGKTPSSMEWLLNPVNKGKYVHIPFIYLLWLMQRVALSIFRLEEQGQDDICCCPFCIILLGLSWTRHYTDQSTWGYNKITKIWSQIFKQQHSLALCPRPSAPKLHNITRKVLKAHKVMLLYNKC